MIWPPLVRRSRSSDTRLPALDRRSCAAVMPDTVAHSSGIPKMYPCFCHGERQQVSQVFPQYSHSQTTPSESGQSAETRPGQTTPARGGHICTPNVSGDVTSRRHIRRPHQSTSPHHAALSEYHSQLQAMPKPWLKKYVDEPLDPNRQFDSEGNARPLARDSW